MDERELAKACLSAKKDFVDAVSAAISGKKGIRNVEGVEYEMYENADMGWRQEYVIVRFVGGAFSPRSVNCDSHSAILRELGELVDGGHYDEVGEYEKIKSDPAWSRKI